MYYQYHKNHFHDNKKYNLYKMTIQALVEITGIKSCNTNTLSEWNCKIGSSVNK
jgi:hypothetical protein